jgi:WXG100 family type VII secretion target
MATGNLRVDIDAVQRALGKYTEGAGTARNVLQAVQSICTSIPGVWKGMASSTYQNTINDWCGQYGRVVSQLDIMRDALSGNARILAQAEHDAQAMSRG